MSSSEQSGPAPLGRIILSAQSQRLGSECRVTLWTEEAEAELMVRVRAKAREQAKEILAKAMEEVERLKSRIREDAYAECLAQVRLEIGASHEELCARVGGILTAISKEQHTLCDTYRKELVELLKVSVGKAVRKELEEDGERCLNELLEEGLELLDAHRELTVTVRPQDAGMIEELLNKAKAKFPSLERWRVKPSATLAEGGVILETGFGLVDNSISGRLESVRDILDQLSLGENGE
jgi:flagellar assembly protein FliH